MSQDALISVRFQGYCLQIRMPLDSQIIDVVQILRDNDFIPSHVPTDNLLFFNKNRLLMRGRDQVSKLIDKNESHSSCELLIQISGSRVESQKKQEPQKNYANDFLKKIALHLKRQEYTILLNAKNNPRIESGAAESLASIGESFLEVIMQKKFYRQTFDVIFNLIDKNSEQNQFQKKCIQYEDYIQQQQRQNARSLCKKLFQMVKKVQDLGKQRIQLSAKILNNMQIISRLKNELQNFNMLNTQTVQKLKNQLQTKNSQINKVNSLLNTQKSNNNKLKNQINALEIQNQSLKKQINNSKERQNSLQISKKQLNQQLQKQKKTVTNLAIEVSQLTKQLHQKQIIIRQKQNQINKLKSEGADEQISQYIRKISKPSTNPTSLVLTLQKMFGSADLAKSLKQIVSNQMRKQIASITQLFSFDKTVHQGYSFKGNFIKALDNRRSLLFIARSQTQEKVFGAFTEEKYQSDPQNHIMQSFDGCSFLFSLIDHKIEYFNFINGQNSIIYDPKYLVFGSQDLMLDFDKNKCLCKFANGKQSLSFKNIPASSVKGFNFSNDLHLSKRFISDQGYQECNVLQYSVYEVKFNQNK